MCSVFSVCSCLCHDVVRPEYSSLVLLRSTQLLHHSSSRGKRLGCIIFGLHTVFDTKNSPNNVALSKNILTQTAYGDGDASTKTCFSHLFRKYSSLPSCPFSAAYLPWLPASLTAAFNFVDEDMSGCLDSEEWRRFLDRFKSTVAVINMRSMFLHLDKVCTSNPSNESVGIQVPVKAEAF